ncbi:homoserine kinase [Croceicoccus marinus]|uniref:Homoserine kinase n=1 Tax=Croceicoccus marinus TaxID=450378 RepID=A0A1Z1FCW3_9SPHN|nr:homoserine kinase [Croceicoccus marinus]ARU16553.1 homoserine kinase [Croceicoccus marinus]
MAVYTRINSEDMAALVAEFGVGELVSAKGIAEGVSNSNWLLETRGTPDAGRFILTVYEERTDTRDLPFFLDLLDHLAAAGCPVPRTIHDAGGSASRTIDTPQGEKMLALIEFLPGVSADDPTPAQAHAVGAALAQVHLAGQGFEGFRKDGMGPDAWRGFVRDCAGRWGEIDPALEGVPALVDDAIADWPDDLPVSTIHADLFPDNVLLVGDDVSGMIDFYFACTGPMAYDIAVTHAAWSFSPDGRRFNPAIGDALLGGYGSVRMPDARERAALPALAQAACLRFLLTRAYDWLNTPADAMVTRKDPLAFLRRHAFYRQQGAALFGALD